MVRCGDHHGIDILVVNTGGPLGANFDGVTDDMWRQAFEGLWISTVQLIRGSLPDRSQIEWAYMPLNLALVHSPAMIRDVADLYLELWI